MTLLITDRTCRILIVMDTDLHRTLGISGEKNSPIKIVICLYCMRMFITYKCVFIYAVDDAFNDAAQMGIF